jgi:hypothetical protein
MSSGVVDSNPFSTLIIRNVPENVDSRDFLSLLQQQTGFSAHRKIRNITFVDFVDIKFDNFLFYLFLS